MKTLPTLYKQTKTGATQVWRIFIDKNSFWTESGQLDGIITKSAPTFCEGKNIGKSNETTPEEQAELEAQAKWVKKTDGSYKESLDDIEDGCKYFEPTLAKKYNDHKHRVKWVNKLASRKINGLRVVNLSKSITTRKGEDVMTCPHIVKALIPFFNENPNGMIDGEGFAHGEFFEDVISIFRKKKPTAEDIADSEKKAQLWIFDGYVKDPSEPFSKRFSDLKKAILKTVKKEDLKYFVFVENTPVNSHEEFMAEHDKYAQEGFEGAMLRDATSPYENKRTANLLKYKNFIDEEFEVVDILEGKGSDTGKASKVVVRLKDGRTCEAGMTGSDSYTKEVWRDRKKYIGKLATIKYQTITKYGKLQFGTVECLDPIDR